MLHYSSLKRTAPYLISTLFMGLTIYLLGIHLAILTSCLLSMKIGLLCFAFLVFIMSTYILSIRLSIIYKFFNINATYQNSFYYNLIGLFFNNFLPTTIGGDVIKAIYASNSPSKISQSILASLTDRFIGFGVMLVLGYYSLIKIFPQFLFFNYYFFGSIILIIVLIIMFKNNIGHALNKLQSFPLVRSLNLIELFNALKMLSSSPITLLNIFLLSIISIILSSFEAWLIAISLGLKINLLLFLWIIPLIGLSSIIPTINGIGVREAGFVLFLKGIASGDKALVISLLFYFITVLGGVLGGMVLALRKQFNLSFNLSSSGIDKNNKPFFNNL